MSDMEHKPRFSGFKEKVNDSFLRQKFMTYLQAELVKVEPGFCEICLNYKQELTQQHGFFHAGIVSTLADNAAGYAAYSLMEEHSSVLTVEFKLNLLAPADGSKLISRAAVLKSGKTLTICRTDVYILRDGREKLCAAAQTTLIELKNKSDESIG